MSLTDLDRTYGLGLEGGGTETPEPGGTGAFEHGTTLGTWNETGDRAPNRPLKLPGPTVHPAGTDTRETMG